MTGLGVRIAVIDSGVAVPHPHIVSSAGRNSIAGGVSIDSFGESPDYHDVIGHGTAVTAAILEKAPDAQILAVRVFKNSLRTEIAHLLRALEWSIEQRADLINLSLGTSNRAHENKFREMIARASEAHAVIVSPANVSPGSLPGVIAVEADPQCPRDEYRELAPGKFAASPYPRPIPGVPQERNLSGISFAVANLTGFAAQVCENPAARGYAGVCAALSINSSSKSRSR